MSTPPVMPFALGEHTVAVRGYVFDVSDWVENKKLHWPITEKDTQWFALFAEAMDHVADHSGDVLSAYVLCVEQAAAMVLRESREEHAKRYVEIPISTKHQFKDKAELVADLFFAAWNAKEGYPPGYTQLGNLQEDLLLVAGIVNVYRTPEYKDVASEMFAQMRPEDREDIIAGLRTISQHIIAGIQVLEQHYSHDNTPEFLERWYQEGDFISPGEHLYIRPEKDYEALVQSPRAFDRASDLSASVPRETVQKEMDALNEECIDPMYNTMRILLEKYAEAAAARVYCADDYSTFHSDSPQTQIGILKKYAGPYKANQDIFPTLDDRIARQELLAETLTTMREICGASNVTLPQAALRVNAILRGETLPFTQDICLPPSHRTGPG